MARFACPRITKHHGIKIDFLIGDRKLIFQDLTLSLLSLLFLKDFYFSFRRKRRMKISDFSENTNFSILIVGHFN